MSCNNKRIKLKADTICTKDLSVRIKIQTRTKIAVNDGSTDASLRFTNLATVWAMQQSTNGEESFDSTNIIQVVTDKFYIRYRDDIDITKMIEKSEGNDAIKFRIIDIENLNGKSEFLLIRTSRRGNATIKNNHL